MELRLSTIQGLMIPSPKKNGDKPVTFLLRPRAADASPAGRSFIPTARDNIERELQDLGQARVCSSYSRSHSDPNCRHRLPQRPLTDRRSLPDPLLYAICAQTGYRLRHGNSMAK